MKKLITAAGILAALTITAGCAQPKTVHNRTGASFSVANADALTAPVSYESLQLAVPSQADIATAAAETTPQAALDVCTENAYVCPVNSGTATIQLALATTDSGGTINPDGTITRAVDNRLVYALTWQNAQCPKHSGAVQPKGASVLPQIPTTCTAIVLVDAASGKSLGMLQVQTPVK